jgi:hypothetical protein
LEIWELSCYDNSNEDDEEELLVFKCWPHVEIAARKLVEKMNERKRKFNKMKTGKELKKLFMRGVQEFPEEV